MKEMQTSWATQRESSQDQAFPSKKTERERESSQTRLARLVTGFGPNQQYWAKQRKPAASQLALLLSALCKLQRDESNCSTSLAEQTLMPRYTGGMGDCPKSKSARSLVVLVRQRWKEEILYYIKKYN
jgi:hypothetical protein